MATASASQQLVFKEVQSGNGNIAVQAAPGAGKSYTLVEALNVIPRLKKIVFLSFSNAIVNELRPKIPKHVKAATLHSLGYRMILARYKNVVVDENKYFKLALEQFEKRDKEIYKKCFTIQELCNYARLTLSKFDEESLKILCDYYLVDANPEGILIASIILEKNTKLRHLSSVDFCDMVYYPAAYPELITETFDYVCLDESQDTNNCQVELINNIIRKPGGRIIAVGDEKQSIFGFQGSNIDSFQKIQARFNTKVLYLKETFRCAKAIVRLAQTIYPDVITEWANAPEGEVRRGELREAQPGDMVICRNTRPLIAAFFQFIDRGVKSYVVGKDLEKGLISLADSVSGYTHERVKSNIDDRLETLLTELEEDGVSSPEKNPKYLSLLEKSEILLLILEKCTNSTDLVPRIREIFHEDKLAVRLLTAHRSKGLECKRVLFIENFNKEKLLPSKYAILDWQLIQEMNLLFVVYTRAKETFLFVDFEG